MAFPLMPGSRIAAIGALDAYAGSGQRKLGAEGGSVQGGPAWGNEPGLPSADDAQAFQQALADIKGKSVISANPATAVPATNENQPLGFGDVSGYIRKRDERIGQLFDQSIDQRSPTLMLKATVGVEEAGFENDLIGKVIGKTFSGVDALTKLS